MYVASVIALPKTAVYDIEQMLANFIWNGKRPKVKSTTLISQIQEEELKLIDIHSKMSAVLINWVKRMENGSIHPILNDIILNLFGFTEPNLLFNSNLDFRWLDNKFPPFYKSLFEAWAKVRFCNMKTALYVRHDILWLNKNITINQKSLNWKNYKKAGIQYIQHIVDKNGLFLAHTELEEKYNIKINILNLYTLQKAIPDSWKQLLCEDKDSSHRNFTPVLWLNINDNLIELIYTNSKIIYWQLVN
jgi:hypothetical protein